MTRNNEISEWMAFRCGELTTQEPMLYKKLSYCPYKLECLSLSGLPAKCNLCEKGLSLTIWGTVSGAPLLAFTRLESPARDEHFSLFGPLICYKGKMFSNNGPWSNDWKEPIIFSDSLCNCICHFSGLYYKDFTVVNDASRVVMSDATIWIITYDCNGWH